MKYYVTLTGLNYRFGTQPFTVGQKVKLVKEPDMGQAGLPPVDPATGLPFGSEEDAIAF